MGQNTTHPDTTVLVPAAAMPTSTPNGGPVVKPTSRPTRMPITAPIHSRLKAMSEDTLGVPPVSMSVSVCS